MPDSAQHMLHKHHGLLVTVQQCLLLLRQGIQGLTLVYSIPFSRLGAWQPTKLMAADEHAYWLFRKDTAGFSFDSLKDNRHSQVLWTGEVLKSYEDRLPVPIATVERHVDGTFRPCIKS